MTWPEYARAALEIAREAGSLLRDGLRERKSIDLKSSEVDLVTQYDQAAEALITRRLQERFPGHGLVAEDDWQFGWRCSPFDLVKLRMANAADRDANEHLAAPRRRNR